MKSKFTRVDGIATGVLCVIYALFITGFCTVGIGRQEVGGSLLLIMAVFAVTYLAFIGVRISSPIFSLCVGATVAVLSFLVPMLIDLIVAGESLAKIALLLLVSIGMVVLPTSVFAALFAWAERKAARRTKWLIRTVVIILLVSATGMASFMSWQAWDKYSPGKYGQNIEFRVLAKIGKNGLTKELIGQSPGIGSPPRGYIWVVSEVDKLEDSAISLPQNGQVYVLVHDSYPWIMTHKADTPLWAIRSVEVKEEPLKEEAIPRTASNMDTKDKPEEKSQAKAIRVFLIMRLDYRGAKQLETLTEQCVRDSGPLEYRRVGILIRGKLEHTALVRDVLYAFYTRYINVDVGTASTDDKTELQKLRKKAQVLCDLMRQ